MFSFLQLNCLFNIMYGGDLLKTTGAYLSIHQIIPLSTGRTRIWKPTFTKESTTE